MYTSSDTILEWPEERLLFESDCSGGIIEVMVGGLLARYGTHQETVSGRLEQVSLPSDSRLTCLGRGHYSSWILINGGMGLDMGTIQITPWAIIYVRSEPLARYGTGVNHYQMWLNIVIKFVKIPYLLTSKKVEGSLSKLLCMS